MKNLMKLSVVLVAAALVFSSCNCFKKMAENRDDINLTVTPEILTLNNGIVAADINVTFPVKYFNAKAVIKVTPVIVFDGGEVAGAAKYLQGSKVDENYTVIDKKNGGNFTQHVEFPYDPRMDKCALQLRAEIKCPGGKCKEFTLVNLNTGAIPTKEQAAVLAGNDAAAKAAIAKKALPKCNIVYRNGQEMKEDISAYLQVLYDASPAAVGGKLPDDNFYYTEPSVLRKVMAAIRNSAK